MKHEKSRRHKNELFGTCTRRLSRWDFGFRSSTKEGSKRHVGTVWSSPLTSVLDVGASGGTDVWTEIVYVTPDSFRAASELPPCPQGLSVVHGRNKQDATNLTLQMCRSGERPSSRPKKTVLVKTQDPVSSGVFPLVEPGTL